MVVVVAAAAAAAVVLVSSTMCSLLVARTHILVNTFTACHLRDDTSDI